GTDRVARRGARPTRLELPLALSGLHCDEPPWPFPAAWDAPCLLAAAPPRAAARRGGERRTVAAMDRHVAPVARGRPRLGRDPGRHRRELPRAASVAGVPGLAAPDGRGLSPAERSRVSVHRDPRCEGGPA